MMLVWGVMSAEKTLVETVRSLGRKGLRCVWGVPSENMTPFSHTGREVTVSERIGSLVVSAGSPLSQSPHGGA